MKTLKDGRPLGNFGELGALLGPPSGKALFRTVDGRTVDLLSISEAEAVQLMDEYLDLFPLLKNHKEPSK
jgi:hypothetical protein